MTPVNLKEIKYGEIPIEVSRRIWPLYDIRQGVYMQPCGPDRKLLKIITFVPISRNGECYLIPIIEDSEYKLDDIDSLGQSLSMVIRIIEKIQREYIVEDNLLLIETGSIPIYKITNQSVADYANRFR